MKKLSPSTVVLAAVFCVLLVAYSVSRVVQYEAVVKERRQLEQQPGASERSRKMEASVQAMNAAGQKMRDEMRQEDQKLTKAGIHGEERKRELLKSIAASVKEMKQTMAEIRKQQREM